MKYIVIALLGASALLVALKGAGIIGNISWVMVTMPIWVFVLAAMAAVASILLTVLFSWCAVYVLLLLNTVRSKK